MGTATADVEPVELMALALEAAGTDAGPAGILERVDRIAVPQGSWSYPDPARLVAARVRAGNAQTHLFELGIAQQSLVNEALAAVVSGRSELAAVVGGEARLWARDLERSGGEAVESDQPGVQPDVVHRRQGP
ncbi:MAG TPA: hypothetical protein VHW93_04090, partial [Acidimicrobiales bacterium]|nr:hypothetical protein [Acidimicrobiales bacterium]